MAKDCRMLPPPPAQLPMIGRMADTAMKADPSNGFWTAYAFAKGLAEYRLGHFDEARQWLQKVLAREGDAPGATIIFPARTVQAYATLAMAQFGLKQTQAAHDTLAKAKQLAETKMG